MNDYTVTFTGDYYSLTTIALANNKEEAEQFAIQSIHREYGWDIADTYHEIKIKKEGVYN